MTFPQVYRVEVSPRRCLGLGAHLANTNDSSNDFFSGVKRLSAGLMEACCKTKENVGIIATMPLGGGGLTGKYMYEHPLFRVSK